MHESSLKKFVWRIKNVMYFECHNKEIVFSSKHIVEDYSLYFLPLFFDFIIILDLHIQNISK